MRRKIEPSDEHERRWAKFLASLSEESPDNPSESLYADISPEMREYREEMEARQAETASHADSSEDDENKD
jgi:hypothetical protein